MEFQIDNGVLVKYSGDLKAKDAVVPKGVTVIGKGAFKDCENIQKVVVPEGVTAIELAAFAGCKNLNSVTLPEGLTEIGDSAFHFCKKLKEINIPDSVTDIRDSAFYGCSEISRIVLPEGLSKIDDSVFAECHSLREVIIPESVRSIGNFAFSNCKRLSKITIPEGVTDIGDYAFDECSSLDSITIPESVTRIGDKVFGFCEKLKSVTICGCPVFEGFLFSGNENKVFNNCENLENFDTSGNIGVIFGESFPPKLDKRKLLPLFTDDAVKTYAVPDFDAADTEMIAEVFLVKHSKNLVDYYSAFSGNKLNDVGREIIKMLSSGNLSEELCTAAADYILLYYNSVEADILKSVYEMIKSDKSGKNAVKLLKNNPVALSIVDSSKTENSEVHTAEMTVLRSYSRQNLSRILKDKYGILPSDLPLIQYRTGERAAAEIFAYLLIVNDEYTGPGICPDAENIVNDIDYESLQDALRLLADTYFVKRAKGKKTMLAYPFCRYADEEIFSAVSRNSKKWHTSSSGENAPLVREFRKASVYSTSHSAALFADDYHDIESYAQIRGMTADEVRDTVLSETELDNNGRKVFELGSLTIAACLQNDASFILEFPDGKSFKSISKKYADEENYENVKKEFEELKKKCSRIIQMRYDYLFECFLDGHERQAAEWEDAYFKNPLLKKTAMRVVWAQDNNTFVMTENGLVCGNGAEYRLSANPVKVAHPVEMNRDDIENWKKYFSFHNIEQPFEQIYEPVYDPESITENRYQGIMISYGCFLNQTRHGIHVRDEDYHDTITITIDDVSSYVKRIDWERHDIDSETRFTVEEFRFSKFTRKVNHIIAYLDKICFSK